MIARRGTAALAAAAALAGAAAGCRGTGAGDTGPGFEVLETRPADLVLDAGDLCPTESGRREYRITRGDGAGSLLVERRLSTPAQGATWIDDPRGARREFWRVDEDGDVVMPAVVDDADGAITIFDPPLVIAPAQLAPGLALRQEALMRVLRLDDPSQARESGTAVQTIEYSDLESLRTADGVVWAARVTITFKADLKMADAQTVTTLHVVPGRGPVVREWSEAVKALGITIRSARRTMVLERGSPLLSE